MTGIPGRSNALEIARRLGLDEEIIQDARGMINPSELRAEDLIDEIHRQLENARQARSEADQIRQDAENFKAHLSEKLAAIDEERLKVMESAREDARQELSELRTQIEALHRETNIPDQTISKKKELRRQVQNLENKLIEPLEGEVLQISQPRPLRTGDRVYVHSLKTDAIVLDIFENGIEVQVGKMRLKTEHSNISRSKTGKTEGTSRNRMRNFMAEKTRPFSILPQVLNCTCAGCARKKQYQNWKGTLKMHSRQDCPLCALSMEKAPERCGSLSGRLSANQPWFHVGRMPWIMRVAGVSRSLILVDN